MQFGVLYFKQWFLLPAGGIHNHAQQDLVGCISFISVFLGDLPDHLTGKRIHGLISPSFVLYPQIAKLLCHILRRYFLGVGSNTSAKN